MNLLNSRNIYSFTKFKKASENAYEVREFAWPVRAWECYANKVEASSLDSLAMAILQLIKLEFLSVKQIASDLDMSTELVEIVINKELLSREYCTEKNGEYKITQKGIEIIDNENQVEISQEKIFGFMFQNLIDNQFFPYFHQGKLPYPYYIDDSDDLFFLDVDEKTNSDGEYDYTRLTKNVTDAYRRFCKIFQFRYINKEEIESEFDESEFLEDEDDIIDLNFDGTPDNEEDDNNIEKLASDSNFDFKKSAIKILKKKPIDIYIKFRCYCLKDNPDSFIVTPAFYDNETSWYSEEFSRLRKNQNVLFGDTDGTMLHLGQYCSNIKKEMFIELPELKDFDMDSWISCNYPEVRNCSIAKSLEKEYRKLTLLLKHIDHGEPLEDNAIINMYRIIEKVLSRYLDKIKRIGDIVNRYYYDIRSVKDIDNIRIKVNASEECNVFIMEKKNFNTYINDNYFGGWRKSNSKSLMSNIYYNNKQQQRVYGKSMRDKFYYLAIEGVCYDNISNFKNAIEDYPNLINDLDNINNIRNHFSAHCSDDEHVLTKKMFNEVLFQFNRVSKALIINLDN